MHERLKAIKERPDLFLGNTDAPFTSLIGYIDGYEYGFAQGEHSALTASVRVELFVDGAGFQRFAAEHYGHDFSPGKGWRTFIREHAQNEQDAFHQFFELLSEYEESRASDVKSQIRALLRASPFVPFVVRMTNGREHRVANPIFVMASPNERSCIILEEENDDRMHYLAPSLIRSVEPVT